MTIENDPKEFLHLFMPPPLNSVAREYWEEGRKEGIILGLQRVILVALKARFMILPPLVEEQIKQVTDTAVLDEAVRQAALVENIEQFSSWLEETSS